MKCRARGLSATRRHRVGTKKLHRPEPLLQSPTARARSRTSCRLGRRRIGISFLRGVEASVTAAAGRCRWAAPADEGRETGKTVAGHANLFPAWGVIRGMTQFPSRVALILAALSGPALAVEIDGKVDALEWQDARHITDFRKVQPLNGEPATYPTEAWILAT